MATTVTIEDGRPVIRVEIIGSGPMGPRGPQGEKGDTGETGPSGPTEVFWATYGTTANAEIEAADTAGKQVAVKRSGYNYALLSTDINGSAWFYAVTGTAIKVITVTSNVWLSWADIEIPQPASAGTPNMDGTAALGSSKYYARADHRHPSDTSKYEKPSGGIPVTDLATAVQTSLGKADTAYQKPGTGIPASDLASDVIPDDEIFWATYGTTTYNEISAAFSAGKLVCCNRNNNIYTCADSRAIVVGVTQGFMFSSVKEVFVSYLVVDSENNWTNGYTQIPSAYASSPEMDGTASAGSSASYAKGDHVHPSDTSKADKVAVVTVSDAGAVTQALDAGKIYDFTGALTSLTITLTAAAAPAQYHFRFDSGSTAPTLTLPNTVTMPDGFQVGADNHYEIDILDGYGAAQSWATS